MIRPIRLLTAAATSVVLIFGTPAGSSAEDNQYTWMRCPEGSAVAGHLDSVQVREFEDQDFIAYVSGQIVPCRLPTATDAYGLAIYFGPGTTANGEHALPFASTTDPTIVRRKGHVGDPSEAVAICLLSAPTFRLDCFALHWTLQNGWWNVQTQRISTDDPWVQTPANVNMTMPPPPGPGKPPPVCPACWRGWRPF